MKNVITIFKLIKSQELGCRYKLESFDGSCPIYGLSGKEFNIGDHISDKDIRDIVNSRTNKLCTIRVVAEPFPDPVFIS